MEGTIHEVKIWPRFYDDVAFDVKPMEVRNDDRGYKPGDILRLREYDPQSGYTGRRMDKLIIHVFKFDDLDADILAMLGLTMRPPALSNLAFLSLSAPPVSMMAQIMQKDMQARPLHGETLGVPDVKPTTAEGAQANIYELEIKKSRPDQNAILMTYLIESNVYHPNWNQWVCYLIHLRDIEGAKPAVKDYPEAEYEMVVQAIDPETPITHKIVDLTQINMLQPPDSNVQFHGMEDSQACHIQLRMMEAVARGNMSPDSDFRRAWSAVINKMVHDLKHVH